MIIKQTSGLGQDVLDHPKKYNGFMGISIRNRFFTKKNMRQYFMWGSKQFKEFVVFLMDDPDKYNFMVFKNLDEEAALSKAREISDDTKKAYSKILRGLNIKNVRILQFRDFNKEGEYVALSYLIKKYVNTDQIFFDSLYTIMENIVGKKFNDFSKKKQISEEKSHELNKKLFQYIIEEAVSVIYFTEKYLIEIDPTPEFLVKKLLYEGKFPDLYKQLHLNGRGHIFIHPKDSYYGETSLNNHS